MTTIDNMKVTLSFGERADQNDGWRKVPGTLGQLFDTYFVDFMEGPKEGRCMLQGELVADARGSKEVVRNYLMMFDSDSGASLDSLEARVKALGLYACVWTTHSHGKSTTTIPEEELLRWGRKVKRSIPNDPLDLADLLADYLVTVKEYDGAITSTITNVSKKLEKGGVKYTVTHAPMTKARVALVLNEPYEFIRDGVTQSAAIDEWKSTYNAVGKALGLVYDAKCQDPARLFYLPRRPVGSDPDAYEIRWCDGTTLDLNRFEAKVDKFAAFEQAAASGDKKTGTKFVTPGLANFLRKYNKWFLAAEWLETIAPDDVRARRGEKLEFRCPADEMHSNAGDETDRAFFAVDADGDKAFVMHCGHATCSNEAAAGGKNWWYLDKACQHYKIEHADELRQFVMPEGFEDSDEDDAPTVEEVNTLKTLIEGLNVSSEVAAKQAAIEALSLLPPGAEYIDLAGLYRANTRTNKPDFEAAIRAAKEARRTREVEDGDNEMPVARHPVPDKPEKATVIWGHWDFKDQLRCTRARLRYLNDKKPELFTRIEGFPVRLQINSEGQAILREFGTQNEWGHELSKRIDFKNPVEDDPDGHIVPVFPPITADFSGGVDFDLPLIERVTEVPVFAKDGSIRITRGYDKSACVYLNPTTEYYALPETVTPDDVNSAYSIFIDATRDFPFTDDFSGSDPEPVRLKNEDGSWADVDDDGHPWPNWNRGVSSRANAIAMLVQPFARAMIEGPCPAYLIDKSLPGTGAGFLASIVGVIMTGENIETQTVAQDEDEFRKEITATLREGAHTIFLDNINHKMDSGALASALTSGKWKGRILGRSDNVSIPIKATWIYAANNGAFSSELMDRIVPIRMDAATPNPRRDRPPSWYKNYGLLRYLKNNRRELIWACQILVLNWVQQGRPDGKAYMGSFDEYSRVMGGILDAAGITGFLENIPAYVEARQEDQTSETAYIERLIQLPSPFQMDDAWRAACLPLDPTKLDTTLELPISGRDEMAQRKSLGKTLRMMLGKTYKIGDDRYQLAVAGKTSGSNRYVVKKVA